MLGLKGMNELRSPSLAFARGPASHAGELIAMSARQLREEQQAIGLVFTTACEGSCLGTLLWVVKPLTLIAAVA